MENEENETKTWSDSEDDRNGTDEEEALADQRLYYA
jgi:hypothetical protein